MSIDARTRRQRDIRPLELDEMLDGVLTQGIEEHGDLARRGLEYQELPALGLVVDGRSLTLGVEHDAALRMRTGTDAAGVVATLDADALSDLLQDVASTMG